MSRIRTACRLRCLLSSGSWVRVLPGALRASDQAFSRIIAPDRASKVIWCSYMAVGARGGAISASFALFEVLGRVGREPGDDGAARHGIQGVELIVDVLRGRFDRLALGP